MSAASSSSAASAQAPVANVAADLLANTGRQGRLGAVAAYLFEPSFATVLKHRWAQALYRRGLERSAKLLWRWNVATTACHLHLDAQIGPGLVLPHPTGVVVGAGARIGAGVTLYQHTTVGRSRRAERYPVIGDGVVVYPGAVIVGPVTVGRGAVIGAGAVVLHDVPERAVVAGNPAQVLRIEAEPAA